MGFVLPDLSTLPGPSRPGGNVEPVDPSRPTSFLQIELNTFLAQLENSNFVIGLEN